ncbi:hypothetical protein SZ64_00630 [Erythrobacter sp. SG61-1L]|uniref:DUF2924 domain-containing protein n=1 Tax=Erythrobacter sp. SG61-1L TaxID=1603897 RepID=UPI0006D6CA26|nr:DUF2924 domain-containing protein [Erythrobacter sp. SG61-1L]KPL66737.1 hypothetical protein SZ64_00630 [Erythrobacter sp. SG61-1L]
MNIARELAAIAAEDLPALRARWQRQYGPPPRLRSAALLRLVLAWRIQADSCGGLDAATRKQIRGGATGPESVLAAGSILTREWQGAVYRVEIADKGFIHDGRHWKSLSQIARHITGTRWNGPRFFGLRDPA